METSTMNNQSEAPKCVAAIYCRVNHSDKLGDGKPTKPQPSKTALYCRVASRHPNDAGAMQNQLEKLRDFAKQQGYNICMEFSDNGYSGNNLIRPAFAEMEAAINRGEVDAIIIRGYDRIARNYLLFGDWDNWRRRKGVQLITLDGSHELTPYDNEIREIINGKKRK